MKFITYKSVDTFEDLNKIVLSEDEVLRLLSGKSIMWRWRVDSEPGSLTRVLMLNQNVLIDMEKDSDTKSFRQVIRNKLVGLLLKLREES